MVLSFALLEFDEVPHGKSPSTFGNSFLFSLVDWRANVTTMALNVASLPLSTGVCTTWSHMGFYRWEYLFILAGKTIVGTFCQSTIISSGIFPTHSTPFEFMCVCVWMCSFFYFFYRMTSVHGKRRIRYTISFHDFLIHLISHIRGAFKMVHFVSTPFFVSLRLSERIP